MEAEKETIQKPPQKNIVPGWLKKLGMFFVSLFLFILALYLLKEGARQLGPFVRNFLQVDSPVNTLGFGWVFAYAVMSGSPVATITLTLLDAGSLNPPEAFAMISGSRLGASFIVLFIGLIYMLRGKGKKSSMTTGLLSLLVTQTTYIPGLFLGFFLLRTGIFDQWHAKTAFEVVSIFDLIFDPIIQFLLAWLPRWVLFAGGFLVLLGSFSLMDRALPQVNLEKGAFSGMARVLYRPIVTFLLGAAVTMVTMSVSLSVSILVPLSMRGYIRRENIIPYVMGANITTFIDTLVAAILLGNPAAFTVVLLEMLSITIISSVIFLLGYRGYERAILKFEEFLLSRRAWLITYMIAIFIIPLILMFI
ncbi:MAG: hypothetical protein OHK0052_26690 [Anaerolineales bacterium]